MLLSSLGHLLITTSAEMRNRPHFDIGAEEGAAETARLIALGVSHSRNGDGWLCHLWTAPAPAPKSENGLI